ncbi:uncharacterized protein LOC113288287 [Papaver somniferum]|uniref:uncharacterized protein LOC113288287 n=1 Tax=Papaver somniferum TaxID=3469 RepID=UPI000E6F83AE|nr:uncharacterized protein LOC113288287 [Papaver somniferum]
MALKTTATLSLMTPVPYSPSHPFSSNFCFSISTTTSSVNTLTPPRTRKAIQFRNTTVTRQQRRSNGGAGGMMISAAHPPPLDLTEDNVREVLADARIHFAQIFDTSIGMTGVAELSEVDGPYVKISLRGRFWHERSLVLARLGNYLKQRIPEILEVDIEDEKQLDDSPENF